MKHLLAQTTAALFAMASLVPCAEAADKRFMSVPRDTHTYSRPAVAEDFRPLAAPKTLSPIVTSILVDDAVVNNIDPALKDDDTVGVRTEVSIAVHNDTIVLTNFEQTWGAPPTGAPLWRSTNGGETWTKNFTINPPPGAAGTASCPCDQTVDFNPKTGDLAGTFLTSPPLNIYSAASSNLTVSPGDFSYFQSPPGTAVPTNHLVPNSSGGADQPWLLVGREPGPAPEFENVYVAYDDFSGSPDMRVAVARATRTLDFTTDTKSGSSGGAVNPGHRLAVDPLTGTIYSVFQKSTGSGAGTSKKIEYLLNRSTDGGKTWTLNDSTTGIVVATADSDQPDPKFCGVNALLGGVDHAAVSRVTGDVVYVYGNRDPTNGINRLAMRLLRPNSTGGLTIGAEHFITVSGGNNVAIPSVAIAQNGTIGVFYYSCDGKSFSGFPIITAHFSVSNDQGKTFHDNTLESFLSPATDNGNSRQRVLGDYQQVKAAGNIFYGGFSGNRVGFYPASRNSIIDPIFFKVEAREPRLSK
jgi:hypothetical protein